MTITTEEAERLAGIWWIQGRETMNRDLYAGTATTLRSLAAERDALKAAINEALTEELPIEGGTWSQEPIGPNETPEEAIKRLIKHRVKTERDALEARAVKWAGIAVKWAGIVGTLIAERDQLIGALQIAVERSGDMETPPAWVDGACSLLNRGFLNVDRAALGEKE